MDNLRFLFLHMPKTAGTNMSEVLANNFGERLFRGNAFFANIAYAPWMIEYGFRLKRVQALACHHARATSIPENSDLKYVAFFFFFDPVDIVPSVYFDLRGRIANASHAVSRSTLKASLRDWLDSGLDPMKAVGYSQVEWLFAGEGNITDVSFALGRYARQLHLFPTERFDDAMICLERLYPDHLVDCSYGTRANVSTKDQEMDREVKEMIESLPWMGKDRELHLLAEKELETTLGRIFPREGELEEAREHYERRCLKKRRLPKRRVMSTYLRVRERFLR